MEIPVPAWNATDIQHGAVVLAEWRVSDIKALNYYHLKTLYCRRQVTSCNLNKMLQIMWLYQWSDLKKKGEYKVAVVTISYVILKSGNI